MEILAYIWSDDGGAVMQMLAVIVRKTSQTTFRKKTHKLRSYG